jgi:hypothetical protein
MNADFRERIKAEDHCNDIEDPRTGTETGLLK